MPYFPQSYYPPAYYSPSYDPSGTLAPGVGAGYYPGGYFPQFYYPPGYYCKASVTSATKAATFLSAIRSRLLDRVPNVGVGLKKVPVGATYPFIVVNPVIATPTITTGPEYWHDYRVQFTVVGDDDLAVDLVGEEAYGAFSPKLPALSFLGGYDMGRIPGMIVNNDRPGVGPKGKTIYHYVFEYTFMVGKEHPTS